MKKILMVVSTLNNGGAQKAFSNIILGFPKDWEIDIVLNDTENIVYPYRGNLINLGLRPQADKTKLWYQAKVFLKRLVVLHRCKRKNRYAACISALTSANAANVLTGNKYCRTILTVRSYMSRDLKNVNNHIAGWIMSCAMRFLYNRADCVVSVSRCVSMDLIKNFHLQEKKAKTIYNGCSVYNIQKAASEDLDEREKKWFLAPRFKLVMVGRLCREKGQWHAIRALKRVKSYIPNIRLFIIGEGDLRGYLETLAEECGVAENVVFCGFLRNPYKIMHRCDAFILPSFYEGFPNALLEALCCEIPSIVTDFPGARELVAPETPIEQRVRENVEKAEFGMLIPVCDDVQYRANVALSNQEIAMADAIIEMAQSSQIQEEYREKGLLRAQQLDMKKVIKQWVELIETQGKN